MLNNKRNKYKTLSDEALLRSYKEKPSLEIIGEYYQRYGHLVMGTSMKYLKNKFDAEDLVMHLFEKLPSKLHDNNINRFKPWLYMVTKNECLMLLRKKGIKTLELIREPKQTNELELKIEKETQLLILEKCFRRAQRGTKELHQTFLYRKQVLPGNSGPNAIGFKKGEKCNTKWQTQFEN
jgi:RNA polymerase sigma-70 factor (ECF subfamily)